MTYYQFSSVYLSSLYFETLRWENQSGNVSLIIYNVIVCRRKEKGS